MGHLNNSLSFKRNTSLEDTFSLRVPISPSIFLDFLHFPEWPEIFSIQNPTLSPRGDDQSSNMGPRLYVHVRARVCLILHVRASANVDPYYYWPSPSQLWFIRHTWARPLLKSFKLLVFSLMKTLMRITLVLVFRCGFHVSVKRKTTCLFCCISVYWGVWLVLEHVSLPLLIRSLFVWLSGTWPLSAEQRSVCSLSWTSSIAVSVWWWLFPFRAAKQLKI